MGKGGGWSECRGRHCWQLRGDSLRCDWCGKAYPFDTFNSGVRKGIMYSVLTKHGAKEIARVMALLEQIGNATGRAMKEDVPVTYGERRPWCSFGIVPTDPSRRLGFEGL